jgi:hypothetical protein
MADVCPVCSKVCKSARGVDIHLRTCQAGGRSDARLALDQAVLALEQAKVSEAVTAREQAAERFAVQEARFAVQEARFAALEARFAAEQARLTDRLATEQELLAIEPCVEPLLLHDIESRQEQVHVRCVTLIRWTVISFALAGLSYTICVRVFSILYAVCFRSLQLALLAGLYFAATQLNRAP